MNSNHHQHWFRATFRSHKSLYAKVILAATMINLLSVASSIFIMVVYDRVIPNAAYSSLFALTAGMVIVLIFDFILKNLRAWFIDLAGHNLDLDVGEDIYHRLLRAPLEKLSGSIGGLANTLREFDLVKEFFTSATLALVVDLPFVFLFILVIYLISGPLAIVPLLAVPLVLGIGILVQPFIARHSQTVSETGKSKYGLMVESLAGLDAIKTNDSSELFVNRYRDTVKEGASSSRQSKVLSQLATNSASTAQLLSLVGIIFYGTFLIDAGTVSMGSLVAAVLLSSRALAPLAQIANLFGRLNAARTAYQKIDQLMNTISIDNTEESQGMKVDQLGDLEWKGLGFAYPESTQPSLTAINAHIKAGEKVAIMGRNGSGKTTLIKLTAGLYLPTQGGLTFDKMSTDQIDDHTFRQKLAVVLQDIQLFSGTLRDNILMGREWIDDDALKAALECSGTQNFLATIPGGLQAVLADRGQSLSTGQRQAIALARALAARPEVLLLDESTAALDLNAEQDFVKHIDDRMYQTLILVTHRLPMLELVDRIIVLADGKIAIDGPREDVLNQLKTGQRT